MDFSARAKHWRSLTFRAAGIKPERHEGGFMSKGEPTILFEHNFVFNKLSLMKFLPYCINWARRLHEVAGRISLKFTYDGSFQWANFMWQGTLFVQIMPEQVHLEKVNQYCSSLLDQNLNSGLGRYYPMVRLWEEVFLPNLLAAIQQEVERLHQTEVALKTSAPESPIEDFRNFIHHIE